jgi:5-formyltetrahydrofolate cyclo-ligase
LKERLRQFGKNAAAELAGRAELSAVVVSRIRISGAFKRAKRVGLFSCRSLEPDVRSLLGLESKEFAFPTVVMDTLRYYRVNSLSELLPGFSGILEPKPQPSNEMRVWEMGDLILVPGLCFGSRGVRIGSGKGYFDRFLSAMPEGVLFMGVCWNAQLGLESLPVDPRDVPMHLGCAAEAGLECRSGARSRL